VADADLIAPFFSLLSELGVQQGSALWILKRSVFDSSADATIEYGAYAPIVASPGKQPKKAKAEKKAKKSLPKSSKSSKVQTNKAQQAEWAKSGVLARARAAVAAAATAAGAAAVAGGSGDMMAPNR